VLAEKAARIASLSSRCSLSFFASFLATVASFLARFRTSFVGAPVKFTKLIANSFFFLHEVGTSGFDEGVDAELDDVTISPSFGSFELSIFDNSRGLEENTSVNQVDV
jgi:hypothetical protein